MSDYAGLIGWFAIAFLILALLNFPVKRLGKKIRQLGKDSTFRKAYMKAQKVIVRQHRFFALAAAALLAWHTYLQLSHRWLSHTGLAALILLAINLFIGAYGHYIRQKKRSAWLIVHRSVAVLLLISIAAHILTGGR